MQALNIHWRARQPWATPAGLLLAVAALLCVGWVAQDYADADAQAETLQARQTRLNRMQRNVGKTDKTRNAKVAATPASGAPSAVSVDAQLQRPWNELLLTLEQTQVKDVALLSLDVQGAARSVRLVGESRGMEPALDYVQKLRQSPQLQKVFLSGQEDKPRGAVPLTRFALDANWGTAP